MRLSIFLATGALLLLPLMLFLFAPKEPSASPTPKARLVHSPPPEPTAQTSVPLRPREARRASSRGSAEIALLRRLGLSDPEQTLRLAREANAVDPASDEAPERAWWAARALVELGHFDEAEAQARTMVREFPDSYFAADVRRHLLTHPLRSAPRDHPAPREY